MTRIHRRRILVLAAALPLMLALAVVLSSNWLTGLYFMPKRGCDPPPREAAPCQVVQIPAADGTIQQGWPLSGEPRRGGATAGAVSARAVQSR